VSTFNDTIDKLRAEIGTHIEALKQYDEWTQIAKLFVALGTIEELAGGRRTSLSELFGFSDAHAVANVKPGEFMGREAVEAAKLYLEKKRDVASSLDEILGAIQKGGAQNIVRDTLGLSLARSTWDVFKAPGQELYTLVKFLPHVKRGKKRTSAEKQATNDADGSGENATSSTGTESPEKDEGPSF
jgi:hypothetical protein